MLAIKNYLEQTKEQINKNQGKLSLLLDQIKTSSVALTKNEKDKELFTKAVVVLESLQKSSQDTVIGKFENTVTSFIQYVTEDTKYVFHVEQSMRGNLQEINFTLESPNSNGQSLPIEECSGGGIKDIISIGIRIAIMTLTKVEKLLLIDESFKALSDNYVPKAQEFLIKIAEELGYQTIMITHKNREEFINSSNNVIEFKKRAT